MQIVQAG